MKFKFSFDYIYIKFYFFLMNLNPISWPISKILRLKTFLGREKP